MKQTRFTATMLLVALSSVSCKKDSTVAITPLASLNIMNATINLGTVKANFTNLSRKSSDQMYYQIPTSINYGGNFAYAVNAGQPVPLAILPASDTTNPVYSTTLNLPVGGLYSLFLAGQKGAVDTVFVKETIPYYTDTSCGVRFINLSPDSQPVNVTMTATPGVNEFAGIAYKQYTGFNRYPAGVANTSYSFQVWNASNDSLLTTYTLSTPYFHNVTLVLTGFEATGNSPSLSISRINNY